MIDLMPFCSTDPNRPDVCAPFSRGEWTYATNGHICVRVSRAEFGEDSGPNAATLFARAIKEPLRQLRAIKLPRVYKPKIEKCPNCLGSGKEHPCPSCECKCHRCGGAGRCPEELPAITVAIGPNCYNAKYIRMLLALPGLRVCDQNHNPKKQPMFFVFDGGEGLLMAMSDLAEYAAIKEAAE